MSAPRQRLPIAPVQPVRVRPGARAVDPASRITLGRVVIAVRGDDAQVLAFVRALRARAEDAWVIGPDSFVGGEAAHASRERLDSMPRHAWVIAAGEPAASRITPTFTIGLGDRHAMASETTDLWLGQSSQVVADALVEALREALSAARDG